MNPTLHSHNNNNGNARPSSKKGANPLSVTEKVWAELLVKFTQLDYKAKITFVKAAAGIAGVDLAPRSDVGKSSTKSPPNVPPPSKKKGGAVALQQPQRQKSQLEKDFLLAKKNFTKARKSAGLGPEDKDKFDGALQFLYEDYEKKKSAFFATKVEKEGDQPTPPKVDVKAE